MLEGVEGDTYEGKEAFSKIRGRDMEQDKRKS